MNDKFLFIGVWSTINKRNRLYSSKVRYSNGTLMTNSNNFPELYNNYKHTKELQQSQQQEEQQKNHSFQLSSFVG
jgi:hypothetical protein